jgi:hypothetical protein
MRPTPGVASSSAPANRGEQHRDPERHVTVEAQERHLDTLAILQNENQQENEQEARTGSQRPGPAGTSRAHDVLL